MEIKKKIHSMLEKENGLTLVELMFSILILGIVLLSCLYTLQEAHNLSKDARCKLLAMNAARSVLETIKNTALVNVPAINTAGLVPADLPSGTITIATNPANLNAAAVATVTITVNWRGSKNMLKNIQVTTMRSIY